jgi:hypothetical protein
MLYDALIIGSLGDRRRRVGRIIPDNVGICFSPDLPDKALVQEKAREQCYGKRLGYFDDVILVPPDLGGWGFDREGYEKRATVLQWAREVTPGTKWIWHNYPVPGQVVAQHYINRYPAPDFQTGDAAVLRQLQGALDASWATVGVERSRLWQQLDYLSMEMYYLPETTAGLPGVSPATAFEACLRMGAAIAAFAGLDFLPVCLAYTNVTPEIVEVYRRWRRGEIVPGQTDLMLWEDVAVPSAWVKSLVSL